MVALASSTKLLMIGLFWPPIRLVPVGADRGRIAPVARAFNKLSLGPSGIASLPAASTAFPGAGQTPGQFGDRTTKTLTSG